MFKEQPHRGYIIARKELREIFRDRRTIISVIISPLLITPAVLALMGTFIGSQAESARTRSYTVGLVGGETAPTLRKSLQAVPNLRVSPISKAGAEQAVKDRRCNAVVELPADAEKQLETGHGVAIQILEDAGDQTSQTAARRLDDAFTSIGRQIVAQRLRAHGLPPGFAAPLRITEQPIAEGGSAASFLLAMLLPYILVASSFGGAVYASFDQVAGEKERGTLETLLVSPASRRDIVLGKFSAVVVVCLISSLLSIVGMILPFTGRVRSFAWLAQGGLHLSPAAVGVTLLVLLPLSVLFAGLLLAVSTFARNQKEAQTYLTPLLMLVLLPAMASMFMGTDVGEPVALIPILNAAIIIKQALSGSYPLAFIALAFTASAVYAALALTFATRLFQKESILIKA